MYSSQPNYGVMVVDSIMHWPASVLTLRCGMLVPPQKDFLLNDMLDLWPDLSRIPQDGAASIEQQPPAQQQQQQQPAQQQQLQPSLETLRRGT